MRRSSAPPRLAAALVAFLVACPAFALPSASAPAPTAFAPLSNPDFPLGTWRMFHANPEHTGEANTTLPPLGHVIWSYRNNTFDNPEGGAALDGAAAFVGLGRDLTVLDTLSGQRLWSNATSGRILSTPAIWNSTVYVGSEGSFGNPNFYAFDEATGALKWRANETPSDLGGGIQFVHSSPSIAGGLVYYGSFSYWLYARDASNGSLVWSANLTSEVKASPAASGGMVFAASAGIHDQATASWVVAPRLWAFNGTSGAEVWNQTINQGHLIASPVVAGGVVYAATAGFSYSTVDFDSGFVLAFDAVDGTPLWTSPDVGRMEATPAVYGTLMYVATAGGQRLGRTGTDARLRELDLSASGAEVWSAPVGNNESMVSSPAVVSGRVVAAGRDGTVALFLASGGLLWSYKLPEEITAPPAVANEMIFVAALDSFFYAFGAQPDFAVGPSDISLSDPTPHVGEAVTLSVTVHNIGDKRGSGTVAAEVNASGSATPVATWNVSDLGIIFGQTTLQAPMSFSAAGAPNITVRITNVTPADGDLSNNVASASFTVLPMLDGWNARRADAHGSNFLETETPQNNILLWKQDAFLVKGGGFLAFGALLVFADSGANRLVALPRADGRNASWVWNAPAPIVGTPVLVSGLVAVATQNPGDAAGNLTFIDPDTGGAVRTVALSGRPTTSGVPNGDEVVLGMDDRLVEVSAATFTVVRELPTIDVPPADKPALRAEPVVMPGWAFAISSVGELHAFNLTSGTEPAGWPVQLAARTPIAPAAGAGFLFAVNGTATLSAYSLGPLSPLPAWNATFDGPITGALGVAYGRVFVPTATNLTALVAGSGLLAWNHTMAPPQPANAVRAVGNSTVFAGSERLFALTTGAGDVDFVYEPGPLGPLAFSAAIFGGTLHLQTANGTIITLGLVPGRPPTAVIAWPVASRNYRTREPINFSSAGTFDPDNQALNFSWEFGDGGYGSGNLTSHTYTFPGDFRVKLTVTDELGLASLRSVDIHVVDNHPPLVFTPDRPAPDVTGLNLDTAIWTFRVRYLDEDGDPPTSVVFNISNETDPVKNVIHASPGPYNYSAGVDFLWTGPLSSGRHTYSFEASDGLDSYTTPTYPPFNIFRVENRSALPRSFSVEYVGQGSSSLASVTGIAGPAGLGVIDVFSLTLPQNSTLLQWTLIRFLYDISVNVSLFEQSTIQVYWFSPTATTWIAATSSVSQANHTVEANISGSNAYADPPPGAPEGPTATFGVFGELKIPPLAPRPKITVAGTKQVFSPGETVAFSAADTVDPNSDNLSRLTFLWEFGDGSPPESGIVVNHTFNRTGNFQVKLTVVNDFGQSAVATYPVTVRSEASESTFLGIAVAIVAALFVVFVLWPVFRRRGGPGAPEPPPKADAPEPKRREREGRRAQGPPPKPKLPGPSASEEETKVVEELEAEFESGSPPRA